jgi:hypothetical protein
MVFGVEPGFIRCAHSVMVFFQGGGTEPIHDAT